MVSVAGLAVLAMLATGCAADSGDRPQPLAAQQTGSAIERGQKVFAAKGCGECHAIDGKTESYGPDLSSPGKRPDQASLDGFLRDPSGQSGGRMPPMSLTDSERADLITYILSIRGAAK